MWNGTNCSAALEDMDWSRGQIKNMKTKGRTESKGVYSIFFTGSRVSKDHHPKLAKQRQKPTTVKKVVKDIAERRPYKLHWMFFEQRKGQKADESGG